MIATKVVDLGAARRDVRRELARRKLSWFVRHLWHVIEPATPLRWSWHLDAVCDHLEAVSRGEIKNLLINVPPRSLKSTIVSVAFPCWEWLTAPHQRYLTSSYALELAIRDAVRSRRVMQSPAYLDLALGEDRELPWVFTGDQNTKSRYENNRTGYRVCTAPGAGGTGEGGSRILVDDPISAMGSMSKATRDATNEWWDKTMSTRANDEKSVARIIVMQRLHKEDLSGHVLEQGGYEWLCLPTEYRSNHPGRRRTKIGFIDPRTKEGELLAPAHFDAEAVADAKIRLGSAGYAGQHDQWPVPPEGNIFKRHWFKFYKTLPPRFDRVLQSWDLNLEGKSTATGEPDFVVGDAWGFDGASAYLLDQTRGQWEFNETLRRARAFAEEWPQATRKLIEKKALGPAMKTMLDAEVPGLILVEPQGSKEQRAMVVQPFAEAGNVYLPDPSIAPWIKEWLDEVCDFPNAKNDDRVDTFTQAMIAMNVNELAAAMRRLKGLTAK